MSTLYATTGELKARLGITDAVDDVTLSAVLEAVCRGIDNYCGRSFYQSAAATVRYYTPMDSDEISIADCVTLTAVAADHDGDRTYEETWASTDYDLLPENAAADGQPYTLIATSPDGRYTFPVGMRKGVKLTGTWGWPDIPAPVHEACLIQAARVFKRKDAPFGIAGTPELGQMRLARLDPDVMMFLDPYRDIAVA